MLNDSHAVKAATTQVPYVFKLCHADSCCSIHSQCLMPWVYSQTLLCLTCKIAVWVQTSGASIGMIAGAVIAGVAAMLVALALFTTYRRRRSHHKHVYMGAKGGMPGRTSGWGSLSCLSTAAPHAQLL